MKHINIIFWVFFCVLLLSLTTACKPENTTSGYKIQGKIHDIADNIKVYLFDMEQQINIDSAIVKNETFTMEGNINYPRQGVLMIPNQGKYASIIIENANISFETSFNEFLFDRKIEGGYEQKISNQLRSLTGKYDRTYILIGDSLSNKLYKNEDHKNELISKYNYNVEESKKIMQAFLLQNPNSYLSLDLIYRNRHALEKKVLLNVLENLEDKFRNIPNIEALERYLTTGEVKKGKMFIDFKAKNLKGETISLSDLKGNYIYLSFWNTYCGPCRKENRFFSENFNELHQDLKLVSFSTDRTISNWKNASEKDGIKWTNLSDLEGNNGLIATRYGVQALPTSFLIDKNGIIIEKFSGYDDNLYKHILEVIDKNN